MAALQKKAARLREVKRPGEKAKPSEESGIRLATISRYEGDELRLNWAEYEGKPYLNIRIWKENDGNWWPVKEKGLTVRVSELADFAEGISLALDRAIEAAETPKDDDRFDDILAAG